MLSVQLLKRDVLEKALLLRSGCAKTDAAGVQARIFARKDLVSVQQYSNPRSTAFHDNVMGFATAHLDRQGYRVGDGPLSVMTNMRPEGIGPGLPLRSV